MGLGFFLVFPLLLTIVSPLREVPHSSCSAKVHEIHHSLLNTSGIHLTLHHVHGPCSPMSLPPLSSYSEILKHDESRVQALNSRLAKKAHKPKFSNLDTESVVTVPLKSGISIGVGNYVTKIGLGTPATDYIMVVDTGSSLTWLQCSPCKVSCHDQVGAVFDPSGSKSYKSLTCSSPECNALQSATLNPSACSLSNVCIYQASYGDSSFSVGYLSKDTLNLGSAQALPGFVYGCGQDNEGLFGQSAGLIGLDRNKLSMLSQLAPKYGNAFSYCLPTTSSTGYLSIGSYTPSAAYMYTPLLTNSLDNALYFIGLTGITVARKPLPVSASAYTGTPTIIDSGTVITRLPSTVYSALSKAVTGALARYPKAPAYSILDTCFQGSSKGMAVPEVAMVFQGGAVLKVPVQGVLIDVDSSTTCLAFASAGSVAIIGNRQQQTFKVVYDVGKSKIGFAPGGCS